MAPGPVHVGERVVPGHRRLAEAVKAAFPDRAIVEVDVNAIAPGGGAIHCITQEQPKV